MIDNNLYLDVVKVKSSYIIFYTFGLFLDPLAYMSNLS